MYRLLEFRWKSCWIKSKQAYIWCIISFKCTWHTPPTNWANSDLNDGLMRLGNRRHRLDLNKHSAPVQISDRSRWNHWISFSGKFQFYKRCFSKEREKVSRRSSMNAMHRRSILACDQLKHFQYPPDNSLIEVTRIIRNFSIRLALVSSRVLLFRLAF